MEICIHHIKPARKHTVQITAKLNSEFLDFYSDSIIQFFIVLDGRTICESDVIAVSVPEGEKETNELVPTNVIVFDNQNCQYHEVLNILNEQIPQNFPGIIISEEDKDSKKSEPQTKLHSCYERAIQLYQLLEKQINERQKYYEA
ncbi:unnamed protein product [Rotaria socialis]|uniref:Uncharacterized protein n=1 Tax=Rotaria socialis TaxID=392032 RepID=A0A820ZVM8_9BILA|nr:unnamed protein product [Rotaria socialis]CAF3491387.1 unnamed protein product [Rotaria socialis]CAF3568291.1 unnamed protein product [Rotaria socialis]CAF3574428.1 unnamed protein product [Rotaria socialis]CAF3784033.1 unnamed protein product [Rotaria socialis]